MGDGAAKHTPLCPAGHLPHKGGDYAFTMFGTNRKHRGMRAKRCVG
jgi:hypothetical protein